MTFLYEESLNALELYESGDLSFYDLVESVEEGSLSEAVINEYFAEQFEFVEAWQNGEVSDEELVEAIESGYLDYELVEGVIGDTAKKVWNNTKKIGKSIINNQINAGKTLARGINKAGKLAYDSASISSSAAKDALVNGAKSFHKRLKNINSDYSTSTSKINNSIKNGRNSLADKLTSLANKIRK